MIKVLTVGAAYWRVRRWVGKVVVGPFTLAGLGLIRQVFWR